MTTIYNPLTSRSVKETGPIGSIIKNIRDWTNVETIKSGAKRMHNQYRFKLNKNWKNDFLKIVEHYSPQCIQQATTIADTVIQQERERVANTRHDFAFDFDFGFLSETVVGNQYNKSNNKNQKNKIDSFLNSAVVQETECECSICLNFDTTDDKVVELKCKHKFHQQCISQWVYKVNNCPMCKSQCV